MLILRPLTTFCLRISTQIEPVSDTTGEQERERDRPDRSSKRCTLKPCLAKKQAHRVPPWKKPWRNAQRASWSEIAYETTTNDAHCSRSTRCITTATHIFLCNCYCEDSRRRERGSSRTNEGTPESYWLTSAQMKVWMSMNHLQLTKRHHEEMNLGHSNRILLPRFIATSCSAVK